MDEVNFWKNKCKQIEMNYKKEILNLKLNIEILENKNEILNNKVKQSYNREKRSKNLNSALKNTLNNFGLKNNRSLKNWIIDEKRIEAKIPTPIINTKKLITKKNKATNTEINDIKNNIKLNLKTDFFKKKIKNKFDKKFYSSKIILNRNDLIEYNTDESLQYTQKNYYNKCNTLKNY